VNDEFGRNLEEAVWDNFNVVFRHFPGGTKKKHENLSPDIQFLKQDLNPDLRNTK
jgi:hypothetical protein